MSQRGMKWVFQMDCCSTRYLTTSLEGTARYFISTQHSFPIRAINLLWTKHSRKRIHQIKFIGIDSFTCFLSPSWVVEG